MATKNDGGTVAMVAASTTMVAAATTMAAAATTMAAAATTMAAAAKCPSLSEREMRHTHLSSGAIFSRAFQFFGRKF